VQPKKHFYEKIILHDMFGKKSFKQNGENQFDSQLKKIFAN
jgi:hypothetical protein